MDIKELRLTMMKAKKDDPEKARVLQAILGAAQLIAKEDGNREADSKDIVAAAKKEIKITQQSKDAGAPYNPLTFEVCESFLPKTLSEDETRSIVVGIVSALPEKSMKMMGKIMGEIKVKYGDSIDSGIASKIVKDTLNS